ncbi:MAG: hypothetical protein GC129_05775 [Proteobacteria bacterium]|nr:hypothetical protein [Pseudomonadota bacterium]
MIKFSAGLAILVFALVLGFYRYTSLSSQIEDTQGALQDSLEKRDEGKNLSERIRNVRKISVVTSDAQKFNIERMLGIGSPGMEWRFIGQPLIRGNNRALFRYTFRISGPSTFAEGQALLERMARLPGFVPYRFCFACTQNPRGTPDDLRVVQIEGYLYAYDPNALY